MVWIWYYEDLGVVVMVLVEIVLVEVVAEGM